MNVDVKIASKSGEITRKGYTDIFCFKGYEKIKARGPNVAHVTHIGLKKIYEFLWYSPTSADKRFLPPLCTIICFHCELQKFKKKKNKKKAGFELLTWSGLYFCSSWKMRLANSRRRCGRQQEINRCSCSGMKCKKKYQSSDGGMDPSCSVKGALTVSKPIRGACRDYCAPIKSRIPPFTHSPLERTKKGPHYEEHEKRAEMQKDRSLDRMNS